MKFTSTIILFLALASLTAATTFTKPGDVVDLKCDPKTSTTGDMATDWTSTNIYAVQVCAVSEADVKDCSPAAKSSLTLTVTLKDNTPVSITPKEFELKDLTDKKSFCHIFELCDFLPQLKDKDLTGSQIKADAIFRAQPDTVASTTFKVSMQATSYVVDKAEVKTVGTDVQPFSVVCNNFACDVAADNVLKVSTKTLTFVDGKAPQCPTATKADEDAKKLYVSLFKCADDGTCPENFKVTAAASTSSTPEPETSEPETESSGALPFTGIASAFIATILSLIV